MAVAIDENLMEHHNQIPNINFTTINPVQLP